MRHVQGGAVIVAKAKLRKVAVQMGFAAVQVRDTMVRNISRESYLHTDESASTRITGEEFASHRTVTHSAGDYVCYDGDHANRTNTVENVFSVFERGMHSAYQHVAKLICIATLPNWFPSYQSLGTRRQQHDALSRSQSRLMANALPIGRLVKPRTLKQLARWLAHQPNEGHRT